MSKINLVEQAVDPATPSAGHVVVYAKTDSGMYYKDDGGSVHAMSGGPALAAGTQTVTAGTVVLSNSNGITFGMSGSSQLTASVDAVRAISAGTATAGGSQVVFSNSNGVTFGVSGSTVTASVGTGGPALVAGTQTAPSGTVVFSNSNGVTFGMSGSSRVTASYSQSTAPGALQAGTQTATSGTVVFSNSNGVTFGMSGSSQITASYSQSTAPSAVVAGTQTATSGSVVFANSNGVTWGMSGSSQITASVSAASISWLSNMRPTEPSQVGMTTNSLTLQRLSVPVNFAPTVAMALFQFLASNASEGLTFNCSLGVYTMSGSTASLASSGMRAVSYNSTLNGSSANSTDVLRWYSITLGTWNLTPGEYLLGVVHAITTAVTSNTVKRYAGAAPVAYLTSPTEGSTNTALVNSKYFPEAGLYTAATGGLPASFQLSQITEPGGISRQYFEFVGTF